MKKIVPRARVIALLMSGAIVTPVVTQFGFPGGFLREVEIGFARELGAAIYVWFAPRCERRCRDGSPPPCFEIF